MALGERLSSKFRVEPNGCWSWTASLYRSGYGQVSFGGGPRPAHRVVYELLVGPIPDGLQLDHLCRNRSCVNPAHLEPVTQAENIRRGQGGRVHKQRMAELTHCKNGHAFTSENTSMGRNVNGNPRRRCLACHAARERARKARQC